MHLEIMSSSDESSHHDMDIDGGSSTAECSTAERRKSSKPIMEKKRRARINSSLNELKTILLDALKKDTARHSKLEKADILEMTVKYLKDMERKRLSVSLSVDPSVVDKYRAGFNECRNEVTRFLSTCEGVTVDVRRRLLNHLASCLQVMQAHPSSMFGELNMEPFIPCPLMPPSRCMPINQRFPTSPSPVTLSSGGNAGSCVSETKHDVAPRPDFNETPDNCKIPASETSSNCRPTSTTSPPTKSRHVENLSASPNSTLLPVSNRQKSSDATEDVATNAQAVKKLPSAAPERESRTASTQTTTRRSARDDDEASRSPATSNRSPPSTVDDVVADRSTISREMADVELSPKRLRLAKSPVAADSRRLSPPRALYSPAACAELRRCRSKSDAVGGFGASSTPGAATAPASLIGCSRAAPTASVVTSGAKANPWRPWSLPRNSDEAS